MLKVGLIAAGTAFTSVIASGHVEFDRTIEGHVASTSDQFRYASGSHIEYMEANALIADMKPDNRYDLTSDAPYYDFDKSYTTRVIPVQTLDGFYRVKLETPFGADHADIEVDNHVVATIPGTIWDHIAYYRAAQDDHPVGTPVVSAESFKISM